VYVNSGILTYPNHDIMVGSFSKFFGLSGLRLGWIGLNNNIWAECLRELINTTHCGLSAASLEVANKIVCETDFEKFEILAKRRLDDIKGDFSKLRSVFSLYAPDNGMFYMGHLDKNNKKILEKAGVAGLEKVDNLSKQRYVRLNMTAPQKQSVQAIKNIIKADKINKKRGI
jgi:aspartate/methionine/tyrosine aminotransferase